MATNTTQTKTVAGRTWHFSHAIGSLAVRGRGFYHPTSVASAPDGILYVLNTGDRPGASISKVTIEEEFIGEFAEDVFTWPEGLAVDSDGNVYCSDGFEHFVAVFSPEGEQIAKWGEPGSHDGQFLGPSGLAFDSKGKLWIADRENGRLQKFAKDGRFLAAYGSPGNGDGQFSRPWGITVDADDNVFVADWGNDRVQKLSPEGDFLVRFGSEFDDGGELSRPSDVAVDGKGDVYVTDWANSRVQIYYPDGDIITGLYGDAREFSQWAQEFMASNPEHVKAINRVDPTEMVTLGRFQKPGGIDIDDQDRIVVTDGIRCRLQVYTKDKDYLEPMFNL